MNEQNDVYRATPISEIPIVQEDDQIDTTRVKCRKCKLNEAIDTVLFRTVRLRRTYRIKTGNNNKALR